MKIIKNYSYLAFGILIVILFFVYLGSSKEQKLITSTPEFRSKIIDLGKVKTDSLYPIAFYYHTGIIKDNYSLSFFPSCGCTIMENNGTKIIKGNDSDSVTAIINTQGKLQDFRIYISVVNSEGLLLDSLIIKGHAI